MTASDQYLEIFRHYKEKELYGRYINYDTISPLLEKHSSFFKREIIGLSEKGNNIDLLQIGSGKITILAWSQMHGNESTTTKAFFDILNFLADRNNALAHSILKNCTIYFIPMLNPDGSKAYTRLNGNGVDLNRDAQEVTQSESKVLREVIKKVRPDLAFNLHGQRTIFSVGDTAIPATVSFLSPAADKERSITTARKTAMQLIIKMNKVLQHFIPQGVGRYDDSFNHNCIGDTLSVMQVPTILFEAGHYPDDYQREQTRFYIFVSLVEGLISIANNTYVAEAYSAYFEIPENEKKFYDLIIRNVLVHRNRVDIGIQYEEQLHLNELKFVPKVLKIDNLSGFYGHREIEGNQRKIRHENDTVQVSEEIEMLNFYLNDELFSTELAKN